MNTVIFDIGRVLVDYDWESYLKSFGYDETTYNKVADAVFRNDDWLEGDRGSVENAGEWLDLFIANEPSCEKEIREVFARLGETILPFAHTPAWIEYFRKKGYRLYYLSNFSAEVYRQSCEKLKFLEGFDGGIFSWKEKCIKPEKEIYLRLLERYHIRPEEAVFYDDRPENVAAAESLGIQGVVFHNDLPLQMMGK